MGGCKHYTEHFSPNGCGSKGKGWKAWSYHLIPNFVFKSACNCHDYAYFYGGCKFIDKAARYNADMEFYLQMRENIKKKVFFRRWDLYSLAKLYFDSVRLFGKEYFNWFDTDDLWDSHRDDFF